MRTAKAGKRLPVCKARATLLRAVRLEPGGARAAAGAAADRERRRAAAQGYQPARGLMSAISRGPYFFGLWPWPLRHETAAGGSPRLCTRPAKPQARGPGIKSACGTCARMGTVNVTPRRVSGSPGGIVLPPYGKLPEQTRAARLRRQGDAQAQAVQVRPA